MSEVLAMDVNSQVLSIIFLLVQFGDSEWKGKHLQGYIRPSSPLMKPIFYVRLSPNKAELAGVPGRA